jgi:hypothetical protein
VTWTDATRTSTRSLGNFSRLVTAKDVIDAGQRGVDFADAFTDENAWSVTTLGAISFSSSNRENPV